MAYVLGLLDGGASTMTLLESLPARLGASYHRIGVACPSYQPRIDERRLLESIGITVSPMPEKDHLDSFMLNMDAVEQTAGDGFHHSADYREVWVGDQRFDLTTNQARVVELLHQQHLRGAGSLSQGYILESLDIRSKNMSQVFRDSAAWRKLVVQAEGRGMYRLNPNLE